MTFSVKKMKAK